MKNKLFSKVTTQATVLVMGSLVAFSGQALAFSSNNRELTNADALGNSESLIAQTPRTTSPNPNTPLTPQERVALARSVAQAYTTLGNALALTTSSAIPQSSKVAIAQSLSQAFAILGNAQAQSNSLAITTGRADAIAESISTAETIIGDAAAIANSIAVSPAGRSVASSIAQAQTAAGNAAAVAEAVAQ